MRFRKTKCLLFALATLCAACRGLEQDPQRSELPAKQTANAPKTGAAPFALPADLSGFLLLWFDEEGIHSARSLEEIPEASRKLVRVRPLDPDLEEKRDPLVVYVADLSHAARGGARPVRAMKRTEFDARVDRATGASPTIGSAAANPTNAAPAGGSIIVYRTSWCGVCERATSWLSKNGHAYIEKDVEKDAGAAQEVQRKLAAAGKSSRGVPVIDVGGQLMVGFDPNQLQRMISGG